jgi:predicted nucleic acid-binding protein
MGTRRPRSIVLDTGALIAIERGDEKMTALLRASLTRLVSFLIPANVLAQAWRDGTRQARLALFLKAPEMEVLPLSEAQAKAAGVLCGLARTRDVVDASVVIAARAHQCAVVTGDPDDLRALDPSLVLHVL